MKKIHKIAFLKIVVSITIAVLMLKFADTAFKWLKDELPSDTIRYCVGAVGFVAMLCVFFSNDEDDIGISPLERMRTIFSKPLDFRDTSEPMVIPKKGELKWSSLMGPVTRERAIEIISKKKRGGRLPTFEELREDSKSPYYHSTSPRFYWVNEDDRAVFRQARYLQKIEGTEEKAYFVIVWDI